MRGEMFDLNPPVPIPITTRPTANMAMETSGFVMTCGIAEKIRRMCPTIAMMLAYWMVK
jgi:hypothetical protein